MAASKAVRWLLLFVLAVPVAARAENNCPWMSEATAGGLLGGAAVGSYTAAANNQPAMCTFMDKEGAAMRELTITVAIDADAHTRLAGMMRSCGASPQLLQAIGNEAAVCAMDAHRRSLSERVVGRVRNQIFAITLSSNVKDDMVLNKESLMSKMYTASEQVAGNLY